MSNYSSFADVYDILMADADYKKRASYIMRLFEKYDRKPELLLDLACGTGTFSNEFAESGIDVIGVDMSEEMLAVARQNSADRNNNILYLCQKAEELDLYGTVDGAVCCLDSLNHITDYKKLCEAFGRVSLFLEENRLFIFDVNTPFKHKSILADNTFIIEQDNIYCVWQNETDPNEHITNIMLDFFTEENGLYKRTYEEFSERAYTESEIAAVLHSAGLETVAIYDDMTENRPSADSERVIYVTRKAGVINE